MEQFLRQKRFLALLELAQRPGGRDNGIIRTTLTKQMTKRLRNALAMLLKRKGDLDGAKENYTKAITQSGDTLPVVHYNLALVLKLAHRDAEATGEFLAAARAGLPRAQYFLGTAYATAVGVERSLPVAVDWWFRAAE